MRHSPNTTIRNLLIIIALAVFVTPVLGQATAIQPCEPTPGSAKPASAANAPVKTGVRASETVIDAKIPDDPDVEKMLAPYSAKVRALSVVIGRLEQTLLTVFITPALGVLATIATMRVKLRQQR